MYICICMCVYLCMYVCVCVYACMYMYVCTYVCMCNYIISLSVSQRTQSISILKTNWLMMFSKIIGIFMSSSETHKYSSCANS